MSWARVFEASWLVDGDVVAALDGYVRARLIDHRKLPPDHPAPAVSSVDVLVSDARRFAVEKRWQWAICALGFMAELVVCAEIGTPAIRRAIEHHERNAILSGLGVVITPVLLLRNALAHPASSRLPGDRFPDHFADWCMYNGEVELGRRLRGRWSFLASEDVFVVAVRRLAGPILRRLL